MVGLGCSSISDSWTAFAQNLKTVEEYTQAVQSGRLPVFKGHVLDREDLILRQHILNLMCKHSTTLNTDDFAEMDTDSIFSRLIELEADGLVDVEANAISVTEHGRAFVRNVCMAFDLRLHRNQPTARIFSATV